MNLTIKILLANIAIALIAAFGSSYPSSGGLISGDFLGSLGLACLGIGVLDFLISIVLFIAGKEATEWAKGFLLSCGVLFLIGFAACSGALGNMGGHGK